ncbi:MAG: SRPBCC family protein [Solirubrobacteraceae bacterium]
MPTARRSRVIPAPPERVWDTVGDPHHLPRWWPRVTRVEGVTRDAFTQVLQTESGKVIRADFRVLHSRGPAGRAWSQELSGTPFARVFRASETEVRLEPEGEATRVTLTIRQKLHGSARFGGLLVRRSTARLLDEALTTLEELHGP